MALGVGVMFTVTVWIVQRGLLQDIVRTAPPGMPNVYLLDVTAANRDAVYKLVSQQHGLEGTPEMIGAVAATIQSIDGVPFEREKQVGMARRYARTVTVSPAATIPAFTDVVAGKWWSAGDHTGNALVSVAEPAAKLLGLHAGSKIVWTTPQKTFSSTVAAVHKSESVRLTARIEFFLTPEALAGLARDLLWRHSRVGSGGAGDSEDILRPVSHHDRGQHGGRDGHDSVGGGSDLAHCALHFGFLDSGGRDHPGIERGGHALPAHP